MEQNICPNTWLAESILAALFCCLPFGIVGIVYAARVSSLSAHGSYDAAAQASRDAKKWTLVSVFAAVGMWILYLFLVLVVGIASLPGTN